MLYSSFQNECLEMDDAQFLIAIALSFMSEKDAYDGVMNFLPLGNTTHKSLLPKVRQERKCVKDLVTNSENGVLRSLIQYLSQNKVIEVRVNRSRIHAAVEKVSLLDLMTCKRIDTLYQKCMQLLLKCPPQEFIYLYMQTEEYLAVFAKDIRKKYSRGADGYSMNVLSDSVISEILDDFASFVQKYSTNNSYNPATCTPIAFLRNTFQWYAKDGKNLYRILNSRGQDFEIGDDGATALDFAIVQEDKTNIEIDFVDICSKINRASRLLFSHNSNTEYFYDIYSYHRDHAVEKLATDFAKRYKNEIGNSCQFSYAVEDISDNMGHRDSIISKKNGRTALCVVLEDIIENGISRKDVYPLYLRLIRVTEQQSLKNGARLFRTSDNSPKHEESNGEMLQILIDGYIALRRLLQFLESGTNTYGITVNSFPVKIFRDARYLKRFNNLEDYVDYVRDVSLLVDAVSTDSSRSRSEINGIFDNDMVYDMLAQNSVVHNSEFNEWRNLPLNYIPTAVQSMLRCNEDEELFMALAGFRNGVSTKFVTENFRNAVIKADYKLITSELIKRAKILISSEVQSIVNYRNIHVSVEFFLLLERAMKIEAHPVCNDADQYLLSAVSIKDEFDYFPMLAEKLRVDYNSTFRESHLLRIIALHKMLLAFTGIDKTKDFDASFADLRNVFSIIEMYDSYMRLLEKMVSKMVYNEKNMYLTLSVAAQHSDLLELPQTVCSWNELVFIYSNGARQFSLLTSHSAEECAKLDNERNHLLVVAINKLLSSFEGYSIMQNLNKRVHLALREVGSIKSDVDTEEKLREADLSLMSLLLSGDTKTAKIRKMLEAIATFDSMNYVQSRCGRLSINSTYYHKSGYKVVKRHGLNLATTSAMTEDDVNIIELQLSMGV